MLLDTRAAPDAGPRCTSRHGRCCACVRAHAGLAHSRCTACRLRNGRCRRSARTDCSGPSTTLKSPSRTERLPGIRRGAPKCVLTEVLHLQDGIGSWPCSGHALVPVCLFRPQRDHRVRASGPAGRQIAGGQRRATQQRAPARVDARRHSSIDQHTLTSAVELALPSTDRGRQRRRPPGTTANWPVPGSRSPP
jgi:hypothetical protein